MSSGSPRSEEEPSLPISILAISAVPSPGPEEDGTPTPPTDVEDRIVTQVVPGVAAVPMEEETTATPDFTMEPGNQTEWEPAPTFAGTSPLPGAWGLGSRTWAEVCPVKGVPLHFVSARLIATHKRQEGKDVM